MRKTLLYLFLALSLGAAAWWTLKQKNRKSTLDKLDLNFSVPDTASINKVVITQFPGLTSTLERKAEGHWVINDRFTVAPVLMDVLLTTIRNVEMLRPLAKNERQTVLETMEKRHRKVEIYVKGELYKTYFIGDDAPEIKGTYFKLDGGDPYVVYLRGFNGFLTPRYNVNENDWRDRILFSSSPQTIQSVDVQYTKSPADNFHIGFSGRKFFIEGANRFDTAATANLLMSFKQVYVERYINGFPPKTIDSLKRTPYEWSLELIDIDKTKSHQLQIYNTSDPDRVLAYLTRTNEWATIQTRNLIPVRIRRMDLVGSN